MSQLAAAVLSPAAFKKSAWMLAPRQSWICPRSWIRPVSAVSGGTAGEPVPYQARKRARSWIRPVSAVSGGTAGEPVPYQARICPAGQVLRASVGKLLIEGARALARGHHLYKSRAREDGS